MPQTVAALSSLPPVLELLERHFGQPSLQRLMPAAAAAVPRGLWERSLAAPLRDFLSRPGKEIRARLVELGYEVAGGTAPPPAALPAIVELLHAGSLIVDDIQDGSAVRRGGPALHHRHGLPVALNAGNYLYFWPLLLLDEVPLPDADKLAAHRRISETLVRCHHGQALDVSLRVAELARRDVPSVVEGAARLKTGSLTALCLWLGARAGGALPDEEEALDAFGEEFGLCLQMLDDLSGLLSPRRRDKGHEDLAAGRLTWPWAWLALHATSSRYERLRRLSREVARGRAPVEDLLAEMHRATGRAAAAPIERRLHAALAELRRRVPGSPALAALEREARRLEAAYA
jgi:geranylgeranyl pyrophosphate synthase